MDNNQVVMASGAAMVALAIWPSFSNASVVVSGSTYKRIWAAGMLTVVLAGMSSFIPEVTGPLALSLILLAIVQFEKSKSSGNKPAPHTTPHH